MIPDGVFAHALRGLFAPINHHLDDPQVSEVLINGPRQVFIERAGKLERSAATFDGEEALLGALRALAQYAGRCFDAEHPILEARMPDGSRVEAVLAALARGGTHVAIRRFRAHRLDLDELVQAGSLSQEAAKFLGAAIEHKRNVVVAGGTGSGKTSLLNVLTGLIPRGERIVVIEDARELSPQGDNIVQLECRPADARGRGAVDVRALFKATLRMRPDRIVIGELRDGAALDLIQAMTSGHGGCLTSLHASHPRDALARLETMALMTDVQLPLVALRSQIASAVDLVVQMARLGSGGRVVTHIAAVRELDPSGGYVLADVFTHGTNGLVASPESCTP